VLPVGVRSDIQVSDCGSQYVLLNIAEALQLGVVKKRNEPRLMVRERNPRTPRHIGFSPAFQHFGRHKPLESPAHQQSSPSGSHQLICRNAEQKVHEVSVKERVSILPAHDDPLRRTGQRLRDRPPRQTFVDGGGKEADS
jgi:hypothetical protein